MDVENTKAAVGSRRYVKEQRWEWWESWEIAQTQAQPTPVGYRLEGDINLQLGNGEVE
jgi:hypothetical protein